MAGDLLIGSALVWLIIWSVMGMKAGKEHPGWLEKMKSIAGEGDLAKFWSGFDGYRMQVTGHAHANSFAATTFLVGLAMNNGIFGYSSQFLLWLAIWMLAGVILAGIGDRWRIVPVAALGGILFLIALIACFIGLFV